VAGQGEKGVVAAAVVVGGSVRVDMGKLFWRWLWGYCDRRTRGTAVYELSVDCLVWTVLAQALRVRLVWAGRPVGEWPGNICSVVAWLAVEVEALQKRLGRPRG